MEKITIDLDRYHELLEKEKKLDKHKEWAKKLNKQRTPEDRRAGAKKAWETRRKNQAEKKTHLKYWIKKVLDISIHNVYTYNVIIQMIKIKNLNKNKYEH